MKDYSVLHLTKYKGLVGMGAHLDRKYSQHNVDEDRSGLNAELSGKEGLSLEEAVEARIAEGYKLDKVIRKDAVRAVGVLMSGSHDRMKEIEANDKLFEKWQVANYQFACREFGKENIVRFTVHRDEKTPHIHCVFVPITKDGRLSAKDYMKGRACMRQYQDRYGKAMEHFGLERGLPQEITQAVHIPTEQYYRETSAFGRRAVEQTAEINARNLFRLSQVREKVELRMTQEYRKSEDYFKRMDTAEVALSNKIGDEIERDISRVKREVNLVKHASSMGYGLDKEKSCRRYAVMAKEGDKVIINTSPGRNGHWLYMSAVNDQDRGTIVDFMLNRGYSYREIRGLSSAHLPEGVMEELSKKPEVIADVSAQQKLSEGALARVRGKNDVRYLEKRKVDERAYKCYLGRGLELGAGKAVFGLYREVDSLGNGRLCSTISYGYDREGKSERYFQSGLPRGLAVLHESGKPQEVVITESPVDSLSYKQQHGVPNALYVSTCGNLIKDVKEELKGVLESAKTHDQRVVLAFDKDEAGIRMSREVEALCQGLELLFSVKFPTQGKDWNEELDDTETIRPIYRKGKVQGLRMKLR